MEKPDQLTNLEIEATDLRNNGQVDAAIAKYHELIEKLEAMGDMKRAAGMQHMIGVTYKVGNYTERSLEALHEAKQRYAAIGDRIGVGRVARDEGITYQYAKDYKHALPLLKESIDVLAESDDEAELGISEVKLGNLYKLQGDMEHARIWLERGVSRLLKTNHWFYISTARLHLSDFLLHNGDTDGALEEVDQAEEILQRHGGEKSHLRRLTQIEGLKALIYKKRQDEASFLLHQNRCRAFLNQLDEASARYLREEPEMQEILDVAL